MATGTLPFRGESTAVIFEAILSRPPVAAVRLNPDLPQKMEEIIEKALEKDPQLRYQHAADLRTDLQRVKRDSAAAGFTGTQTASGSSQAASAISGTAASTATQTREPHPSGSSVVEAAKRHKMGVTAGVIIGLIVLAAAGYGVYSILGGGKKAIPFQNYTITQITDNGKSLLAAISPDGKYILSVVNDAGKASVWLRHVPPIATRKSLPPPKPSIAISNFPPMRIISISAKPAPLR